MKELLIEGFFYFLFFRIYFEKCRKGKMIESTLEPSREKVQETGIPIDFTFSKCAEYTPLFLFSI